MSTSSPKAIEVTMCKGPRKIFKSDHGRPNPTVRFEGQFVIVIDGWGRLNAFPASEVTEVREYFPADD